MSWAKVDDQWFAHPKVVGLSLAARGLWITTLSWSCAQRTDHLPVYMVRFLAGGEDVDPLVKELVEVGLWIEDEEGWSIHDWDEYQNLSLSEKRARAGKKGAEKRWQNSDDADAGEQAADPPENGKSWQSDGKPDLPGMANGMAGARPGPSRPDPNPGDAHARARETNPNGTPRTWDQDWRQVSAAVRAGSNRPIPDNITGRARAAVQRLGGMRQLGSLDPKSAKFDFRDAWKEVGHEQAV